MLFLCGTLLALLLGTYMAIRPGPAFLGAQEKRGTETRIQLQTYYPNLHRLASLEPAATPYLDIVQKAVQKHASTYKLDPLLVLALIKKESKFNVQIVSDAGAAGPMQFMPGTAEWVGLDPVYSTDLLDRANELKYQAGELYDQAVRRMKDEEFDSLPYLIDRWKEVNEQAWRHYYRYRNRLKDKIRNKSRQELAKIDQRFLRDKAVTKGVKYLADLFEQRNGDIREALAAYNGGPGLVRQFNGIPPNYETVHFQNTIVNTYEEYRRYLDPNLRDRDPVLSKVN